MSLPNLSPPSSRRPEPEHSLSRLPGWFPPLFYLSLACAFLWRSVFTGQVFLPAGLLGHIAPYAASIHSDQLPPWNPLRWDGIAQFYPWRHFAAATLHAGLLPLWNPYQFSGTPFVANSQSAVFYPGNILFYLLPTARAFAYSAVLHLTLAGWFLYLLLRRMGCSQLAALFGGIVYAYSAWQVAWLQLPTFLATSCWIPLLLRQVLAIGGRGNRESREKQFKIQNPKSKIQNPIAGNMAALGGIVGLMLLAGHLQIAFYGLLAAVLLAIARLVTGGRSYGGAFAGRMLAAYLGALALGMMLAAPQLLPTIELSGRSHRVGKPTAPGYSAYTEYALPARNLVTLLLPDFYGNDHDPDNVYWGFYFKNIGGVSTIALRHNAAETALYVGIAPLLLCGIALWRGRRHAETLFFAALAALALLMALGTPLNALFYFGIPGFGQSGSPARALVLWALAISILSAFGLDHLSRQPASRRELAALVASLVLLLAISLSLTAQALSSQLPGFNDIKVPLLGDALSRLTTDWIRSILLAVLSLLLCTSMVHRLVNKQRSEAPAPVTPADAPNMPERPLPSTNLTQTAARFPSILFLPLVLLDLFSVGIANNPTSPPEWVYPETAGIQFVREHIGHERIFPVNQRWSLNRPPPAVLPPNGATVYGLRDVQGYDSLLTGRYKAFANEFARPNALGARDASPVEVGNMIFFQDPNSPQVPATGAKFALTLSPSAPEFVTTLPPAGSPIYDEADEMAVYALQNTGPRASLRTDTDAVVPNSSVSYQEDGATRVMLDVASPIPSHLILADQPYPGWRVQIDATPPTSMPLPTPHTAAGMVRIVPIPAGHHLVAFRYEPTSFRVGLYCALVACGLLAATAFRPQWPKQAQLYVKINQ
jgi:hypothetical protein